MTTDTKTQKMVKLNNSITTRIAPQRQQETIRTPRRNERHIRKKETKQQEIDT